MDLGKKIFLFFLLINISQLEAASIKGKLMIDESWQSIIYLSLINSFDDLNTASYDFLIHKADIDSTGYFEMNDVTIPEHDRLYRLHIVKMGDPVSTIIIGGKDENFIHLIMNGQSEIKLNQQQDGFQYVSVSGHEANADLREILDLQKNLLSPPSLPSQQNREILKEQIVKKYSKLIEASEFNIIQLLAIHFLIESHDRPDIKILENMEGELRASDSSDPYYKAFETKLGFLKYQSKEKGFSNPGWIKWVGLIAIVVFLALGYWMRVRKYLKPKKKSGQDLIHTLSIQEKKVFELLKAGASNKEISSELNIEVSTVKSHVHKVYSRLGVKSRKEIVNREW